ncbi:Lrp/AsnC ligand binding domain-containing protein [Litoreibacter roseus]|nr:Lrp/AsnC ligand binding domain-containing protein [Litoreibacter roseus]
MRRVLDRIDQRILDELQRDGRLSIVELARRVFLTKTPTAERVRRLEKTGVISGYHARIAPDQVDLSHVTVVHVNLTKTSDEMLDAFNVAVTRIPEVQSCLMIAGSFDYMLKVRTRNMAHFREVLGEQIGKLPGVMQTHSFAVMETVKDTNAIMMAEEITAS